MALLFLISIDSNASLQIRSPMYPIEAEANTQMACPRRLSYRANCFGPSREFATVALLLVVSVAVPTVSIPVESLLL